VTDSFLCCITLVRFTDGGPLQTRACRNTQCDIVIMNILGTSLWILFVYCRE